MKLSLLFCLLLSLQVTASTHGQTISINANKMSLRAVLMEIQKQSKHSFVGSENLINDASPITVNLKNKNLDDVLNLILEKQAITHEIHKGIIVLHPKNIAPTNISTPPVIRLEQPHIQGTVFNEKGAPLSGASITILGINLTMMTDRFGYFHFPPHLQGSQIIVSYIGYQSQTLSTKTNLSKIMLKPLENQLDEVEVLINTGYQQIAKERSTGSFSTINSNYLNRRPTADILSKLEGFASGLSFNQTSLDSSPKLTIRGRSTIYGEDSPLIVVDGFPMELDLYSINPNDVQEVTILKDAAAASIWGVRAANGVIVITTKKGHYDQKPNIEFRSHMMRSNSPDLNYLPFMPTSEYVNLERTWFDQGRYNNYGNMNKRDQAPLSEVIRTLMQMKDGTISSSDGEKYLQSLNNIDVRKEYEDAFYRHKVQQQHLFSLRGGGSGIRYLFSTGYDKELANERGNSSDRITIRTDNSFKITSNLDLNIALNAAWNKKQENALGLYGMQSETAGSLSAARNTQNVFYPYQRFFDDQGNVLPVPRGSINANYNQELMQLGFLDWSYKPTDELNNRDNRTKGQEIRLMTGLDYTISKSLKASVKYQYENGRNIKKDIQGLGLYSTRDLINTFTQINPDQNSSTRYLPTGDILLKDEQQLTTHNFRGQLDYSGTFGDDKHALVAISGIELRDMSNELNSSNYFGYNDRTMQFVNFDKSAPYPHFFYDFPFPLAMIYPGGDKLSFRQSRFASFYANAAYTYQKRYTFSTSGRMDKSSLFGVKPKDRNVPLWSIGAAWNIFEEPFIQKHSFLSRLQLRSTYGFNGNVSASQNALPIAYAGIDMMTNLPSARISSPANPLLQWEKVSQLNLALELGFWNNKLTGKLEYFRKHGRDLFGDHLLDPSSGFTTIRANVASMRGNGFDLDLNWRSGHRIQWDSKILLSYAMDKVTEIALNNENTFSRSGARRFMRAETELTPLEGRSVYSVYSYKWAGLDSHGNPQIADANGDIYGSENYNSVLTSISPYSLVYNGPARPTYFGGWSNGLTWKGINLSATITYKLGHYFRRPSINYYAMSQHGIFRAIGHKDYLDRWQKPGDEAKTNVPSYLGYTLFDPDRDEAYRYADILVESSSHIRLKDITFSYDLPDKIANQKALKGVQIYLYIDNIGILWRANKQGIDPDYVPWAYGSYLPKPLSLTAGLKLNL